MIIASCGHQLPEYNFGAHIAYFDIDKFGEECRYYKTVCDDCLVWYKENLEIDILES